MKRKVIIATVAAAALVGGGTATAFGVAGQDSGTGGKAAAAHQSKSDVRMVEHDDHDDDHSDSDDRCDRGDGQDGSRADKAENAGSADVSYSRAAHSALKEVPGSITELELDTDGNQLVWDADVLGKDNKWHDVKIDATKGHVVKNRVDARKDEDRSVVRAAKLDADAVGKKAAQETKGAVTSVSLDDDGRDKGKWEADAVDKKGKEHELVLDGASGKVLHHESEQSEGDDD
ncbi:PepSY domain-containing protein [Streptomyces sp. 8N114]|uniref:PepSY domain-containing protein n=1 Tax=Streptomyces sp. 8N114 TaxID=3457419 RepID=UPI003FCF364B